MNTKCFVCKRKLNLPEQISGLCKCAKTFCKKHKPTGSDSEQQFSHICSIDPSIKHKELLKKNNPTLTGNRGLTSI
jgi:hypothetical protein